jgi:hypothetical protein
MTQICERLRWRCPAKSENYIPVFSSERTVQINKPQLSKIIKERRGKIGRGSQMAA